MCYKKIVAVGTCYQKIVANLHVLTLGRARSGGLYYRNGDFRTLFPPFLPLPLLHIYSPSVPRLIVTRTSNYRLHVIDGE